MLRHLVGDLLRDTLGDTAVQVQEQEEVRQKPAEHTGQLSLPPDRSQQTLQWLITDEKQENTDMVPSLD